MSERHDNEDTRLVTDGGQPITDHTAAGRARRLAMAARVVAVAAGGIGAATTAALIATHGVDPWTAAVVATGAMVVAWTLNYTVNAWRAAR